MPLGGHLKQIREKQGLTVTKVVQLLGVSDAKYRKWEERDVNPKYEDLQIIKEYFDMEVEEIMKLDRFPVKDVKKAVQTQDVGTWVLLHGKKSFNIPDLGDVKRRDYPPYHFLPVVNKVRKYNLDFWKKSEVIEFYCSLPNFEDGTFVFTMHGRFMEPLISDHEQMVVMIQRNKKIMSWGEVYLIFTEEQTFVRHVDKSPRKDYWILRPHNTDYGPIEIHENDAKAYFKVIGCGMKRFSN